MKSKTFVKISVSFIIIGLIVFLIAGSMVSFNFAGEAGEKVDINYEVADTISFDIKAANVSFQPTDSDKITISYYDKFIDVNMNDGVVSIFGSSIKNNWYNAFHFIGYIANNEVVVLIPNSVLNVYMDSKASRVVMDSFSFDVLNVDLKASAMEVKNSSISSMVVNSAASALSINASTINILSGKIEASGIDYSKSKINENIIVMG